MKTFIKKVTHEVVELYRIPCIEQYLNQINLSMSEAIDLLNFDPKEPLGIKRLHKVADLLEESLSSLFLKELKMATLPIDKGYSYKVFLEFKRALRVKELYKEYCSPKPIIEKPRSITHGIYLAENLGKVIVLSKEDIPTIPFENGYLIGVNNLAQSLTEVLQMEVPNIMGNTKGLIQESLETSYESQKISSGELEGYLKLMNIYESSVI